MERSDRANQVPATKGARNEAKSPAPSSESDLLGSLGAASTTLPGVSAAQLQMLLDQQQQQLQNRELSALLLQQRLNQGSSALLGGGGTTDQLDALVQQQQLRMMLLQRQLDAVRAEQAFMVRSHPSLSLTSTFIGYTTSGQLAAAAALLRGGTNAGLDGISGLGGLPGGLGLLGSAGGSLPNLAVPGMNAFMTNAFNDKIQSELDPSSIVEGKSKNADDSNSKVLADSKSDEDLEGDDGEEMDEEELANDTFPNKLYRMLTKAEADGNEHIVSFTHNGRAFVIHKPRNFVSEIMPEYFTTSRMSSFQRQLNLYGFRRITEGPDKGAYFHESFQRGQKALCQRIKRKKSVVKAPPNFLTPGMGPAGLAAGGGAASVSVRQLLAESHLADPSQGGGLGLTAHLRNSGVGSAGAFMGLNQDLVAALLLRQQQEQQQQQQQQQLELASLQQFLQQHPSTQQGGGGGGGLGGLFRLG